MLYAPSGSNRDKPTNYGSLNLSKEAEKHEKLEPVTVMRFGRRVPLYKFTDLPVETKQQPLC
jgi:hypothetical protein